MTSECTQLVSEGVLGAPHLYTQDTRHVTTHQTHSNTKLVCTWLPCCFMDITHNYSKNKDKYKMHCQDLCSGLLFCFLYIYNCTVCLAFNKKHWIFSTPRYSMCSLPSHSTHHSLGCTGCLRWERSAFWKDLRSRLCLVWRAAACRGANHLPSTPHHPDSHLNHIKDKTKIKLLISLLNETNTAAQVQTAQSSLRVVWRFWGSMKPWAL